MPPRDPHPRQLFTDPNTPARRMRADTVRRRALSPVRIAIMILMLPVTTAAIAVTVYTRTSEFGREEALFHLIAMAGCPVAEAIIPGPFFEGLPGYHRRNDPDGDGIACDPQLQAAPPQDPQTAQPDPAGRAVGNAKFLRP